MRERTITVRVLDVESGEWREEPKRLAPVSGFDLVFSCPKSVSLLHALTDDERVRREISEAHEAAWQAALGYLEREACVVRRGRGGAIREHGEGFVAAAFRHRTSRAQDPHLHTHVIVANLARSEDGEWRALDGEAILRTYRLAAGYLYEAHLRHELTRRLGLGWTEPVKGMAELDGRPGGGDARLLDPAAVAARAHGGARDGGLRGQPRRRARDARGEGAGRPAAAARATGRRERPSTDSAAASCARSCRPPHSARAIELDELAAQLLGRDGLTAKQTTFTMPELVCAVAGALRHGATVDDVLDAAEKLATFPGVELVEPERAPGRPARFTTRELLEVEREALELALAGRDVGAPRAAPGGVPIDERAGAHRRAADPRARGVHEPRPRRLRRRRRRRRQDDRASRPRRRPTAKRASPSSVRRRAAAPPTSSRRRRASSSTTMHRLLLDAQREGGLPHGCVLVVDEAGMAETRMLAPLLRLVDDAGGKAILVGDPASSLRSARAASSPPSASGSARSICQRIAASTTRRA